MDMTASNGADLERIQEAIKQFYRGKRTLNVRHINAGDSEPMHRYFMVSLRNRCLAAKGNPIAILFIGLSVIYQLWFGKTKQAPATGWYAQSDRHEYTFIGTVDDVLKWLNIRKRRYEQMRVVTVVNGTEFVRKIKILEDDGYCLRVVIPGTFWNPTRLVYAVPDEDLPPAYRYIYL